MADDPLVLAFLRAQSHPSLDGFSVLVPLDTLDYTPRLAALHAARPDLVWDPEAIKQLLFASIRARGTHTYDELKPPWLANFGDARAYVPLLWFGTLDKLGDLPPKHDPQAEGALREAQQHYEATRQIKPSSLVAPRPRSTR